LPSTYDMWVLSEAGHLQRNRQKGHELCHIWVQRLVEKRQSVQGSREHYTDQINSSSITIGREFKTYWQSNLTSSPTSSIESGTKEIKN